MLDLTGLPFNEPPLRAMSYVCDLVYYDGPILSHWKDSRGNHFLRQWCDSDATHNRWANMRVAEATVLRLKHRALPLNLVVPDQILDDFVYYFDVDAQGDSVKATRVWLDEIPEEYLPLPGSFCDEPVDLEDEFIVLIDGQWTLNDWGQFPRKFSQIYSVLYGHNVLRTRHYKSYPWKEGFSSMHFYQDAVKSVPQQDRAMINTMQYASPGFIRFSSNLSMSDDVVNCVLDLGNNHDTILDAVSDIDTFCRNEGLNKAVIDLSEDQTEKLRFLANAVLSNFSAIDSERFMNACPSAFEAAKIAVSFYKRVADLRRFERRELVQFPNATGL